MNLVGYFGGLNSCYIVVKLFSLRESSEVKKILNCRIKGLLWLLSTPFTSPGFFIYKLGMIIPISI